MEKRARPRSQRRPIRGTRVRGPCIKKRLSNKNKPGAHSYFHKLSARGLSASGQIGALKASAFVRVPIPNGETLSRAGKVFQHFPAT